MKRKLLNSSRHIAAAMVVVFGWMAGTVHAQDSYPNRPIKFYVGFPPGGVADSVGRIIAQPLASRLGQPVVIDNRAGAGGAIAVDTVAKSAPDGYAIGFGVSGALTSSVTLNPKLPYDPTKDISPVSLVVLNPLVLVVSSSSGVQDLKDFIAKAKLAGAKSPVTYGTAGPGTAMHLAGELLKQTAGFEMTHIPYKGSAPATMDLLGGQLSAAVLDLATAKPHLQAGRLKALGLTSGNRTTLAPEIPTIAQAGVPGFEFNSWFGMILPPGTPAAIVQKMNTELTAVLNDPKVRQQLLDAGTEPAPTSSSDMVTRIRKEIDLTARLIKTAKIEVN